MNATQVNSIARYKTLLSLMEQNANARILSANKNTRINLYAGLPEVFLLKKGKAAIYNNVDNLCYYDISSESIAGISQTYKNDSHHYLRCVTDCSFVVLRATHLYEVLHKYDLWDVAFNILAENNHLALERSIVSKNSIDMIVMNMIEIIWSDRYHRERTTVYSYILERSNVSRSAIYKVIKELISKGIISITRGRLVNVDMEALTNYKGLKSRL